jgi:hypothetical protein
MFTSVLQIQKYLGLDDAGAATSATSADIRIFANITFVEFIT